MKIGRYEFDINENDLILDNGACYQIVTREIGSGWNTSTPRIAKNTFKEYKSKGLVYTNGVLDKLAKLKYAGCTYWKFNMELVNKWYNQSK